MDLRHYQQRAVSETLAAWDSGIQRVLFQGATGTGKTVIFSAIIEQIRAVDNRPALVLAHRRELLTQAAATLSKMDKDLRIGFEIGDETAPRTSQVVCASVPTIGKSGSKRLAWLEQVGPSVIIVDESHHSSATTYVQTLNRFGAQGTRVLGVTATPKRLDRAALVDVEGVEGIFQKAVTPYPIQDAIRDGYLCPIRGWVVQSDINLDSVGKSQGDFNQAELAKVVNVESRTHRAIDHWNEVACGRKTIVFAVNVEHAESVCEAFNKRNVPAVVVHGKMATHERKRVLAAHRAGEYTVLVNVGIATEGYDDPEISCVLVLRPTQSWGLFVQMVGRGTRLFPGKTDCIVIDVVDATKRHSLASIPSIIDLPASLNLEGHRLDEAAEMVKQISDKSEDVAAILERVTGKKRDVAQLSFQDLKTVLVQINLLGEINEATKALSGATMAWLRLPNGNYEISCGRDLYGPRKALLACQDGMPSSISVAGHVHYLIDGNEADRVRAAERIVRNTWPDATHITSSTAAWREKKPSEKQVALLRRLGIAEMVISTISAGDASKLIDVKLSRR